MQKDSNSPKTQPLAIAKGEWLELTEAIHREIIRDAGKYYRKTVPGSIISALSLLLDCAKEYSTDSDLTWIKVQMLRATAFLTASLYEHGHEEYLVNFDRPKPDAAEVWGCDTTVSNCKHSGGMQLIGIDRDAVIPNPMYEYSPSNEAYNDQSNLYWAECWECRSLVYRAGTKEAWLKYYFDGFYTPTNINELPKEVLSQKEKAEVWKCGAGTRTCNHDEVMQLVGIDSNGKIPQPNLEYAFAVDAYGKRLTLQWAECWKCQSLVYRSDGKKKWWRYYFDGFYTPIDSDARPRGAASQPENGDPTPERVNPSLADLRSTAGVYAAQGEIDNTADWCEQQAAIINAGFSDSPIEADEMIGLATLLRRLKHQPFKGKGMNYAVEQLERMISRAEENNAINVQVATQTLEHWLNTIYTLEQIGGSASAQATYFEAVIELIRHDIIGDPDAKPISLPDIDMNDTYVQLTTFVGKIDKSVRENRRIANQIIGLLKERLGNE